MTAVWQPRVAARELPESMWRRTESHRPVLTIAEATAFMNKLLADEAPDEKPITASWYYKHATRRKKKRLAAAQPAAQDPTPAQPPAAPSAASIDPELGAGDRTPHAADHPDASDGPSSPAHTPTDTPAQQAGQHDTLDDPFADWHESFSIHSEDSEPDSVDSAEWVDRILESGRLHVPGKYSRHWPACPCPCAAVARRVPRAFCAAQASKHTLLLRRPPRQLRLRKSWAAS